MPDEYRKDFDVWNEKKKTVDAITGYLSCEERDIWWCSLGLNIGNELDGKNTDFERTVIIFRKFGDDAAWVIPTISRKIADGSRQEFDITRHGRQRIADISQLRLVSTKRLLRYEGRLSHADFQEIRRIYKDLS
jgi:hypothetical protein